MGELVLHIGIPKTGTTSLQRFFTSNRSKLNDYGWDYPSLTGQWSNPSGSRNGNFLVRLCRDRLESASKTRDAEENMRMLEQSLSSFPHALLSDEEFFYSPVRIDSHCPEKAMTAFWNEVSQVIGELGASSVTCIVYLRRQDEWLSSWWKETVKHGGTGQSFADYASSAGVRAVLSYSTLIETIEGAFDEPCKLIVRLYDRSGFEGGSIFTDFCHAAGIPWDPGFSLPDKELNSSLSYDVAEALRGFRSSSPYGDDLRMQGFIPLAYKLSRQQPDPPGTTPFSKEEADAFMQGYREENARVARRFFGREELFPADAKEPVVWEPDEERIRRYTKLFQEECRRDSMSGRLMKSCRKVKTVLRKLSKLKRD